MEVTAGLWLLAMGDNQCVGLVPYGIEKGCCKFLENLQQPFFIGRTMYYTWEYSLQRTL